MDLLELAKRLANTATTKFPGKIGIIAVYGSVAQGTSGKYSDLDMYALVDVKEDTTLPWSFEYAGYPVDFWQMTWDDAKRMAYGTNEAPWAVAAANFVHAKILVSRSPKDLTRFQELQKLSQISADTNAQRAISTLTPAYFYLKRMNIAKTRGDLVSTRWAAWHFLNTIVMTLSLVNNRFYTKNWGQNLQEAFDLSDLPPAFQENVRILATSDNLDDLVRIAQKLLEETQTLVSNRLHRITVKDTEALRRIKNDIIGIRSYLHKIRGAIAKKDILAASWASTELQIWLTEEFAQLENNVFYDLNNVGFYCDIAHIYKKFGFPEFSKAISNSNFEVLIKTVDAFEKAFERFCAKFDLKIPRFHNIEEITTIFIGCD